jgi:hypothetical protein
LLNQRAVQGQDLDLVVVEPPAKAAHRALRLAGSTPHVGNPGTQASPPRLDEAPHHPCQGLEVAMIDPLSMLAKHLNERIIKVRCVLHASPP